jgi:hypothetical protein
MAKATSHVAVCVFSDVATPSRQVGVAMYGYRRISERFERARFSARRGASKAPDPKPRICYRELWRDCAHPQECTGCINALCGARRSPITAPIDLRVARIVVAAAAAAPSNVLRRVTGS